MTVMVTDSSKRFHGSGSTGPFTWTWRFLKNSDIQVYRIAEPNKNDPATEVLTLLVEGVDYTLTGAGSYDGGSISSLSSPLVAGTDLLVKRATAATQEVSIRNQGNNFRPEVHEDVFDRLTMIIQDRDSKVGYLLGVILYLKSVIANIAAAGSSLLENFSLIFRPLDIITKGPWLDARAYTTLVEADTVAKALGRRLLVASAWNVVPANLYSDIKVIPGGQINNTGPLTIHGKFKGCPNCFQGAASDSISFKDGSVLEVHAEWWGAVAGDATKGAVNKAALLKAQMTQIPVKLGAGVYHSDAGLTLWGNNFILRGAGMYKTSLQFTTAVADDAFELGEDIPGHSLGSCEFSNLALIGNATVGNAFVLGANPAGANGYAVMANFSRVRITGFTKVGFAAFRCVYTWWVTVSGCLIDGNHHAFAIPAGGVTTTILVSDNTEVKSCAGDGINVQGGAIVHDFTCRNASFEYCAGSVINSVADKARFMFERAYLEQNGKVGGAAVFVVKSTTASRINSAYASFKECTSDAPLSGKMADVDYTYLSVEDCAGFVAGSFTTTVNSHTYFRFMNGMTSGDFLATARTLLGTVTCDEYIPTLGRWARYCSHGNIFENHLSAYQTAVPGVAVGPAAGTGATAVMAAFSNDTAGQVQVSHAASGSVAGIVATVTFQKAYNRAPIVVVSAASTKAGVHASNHQLNAIATTNDFTIYLGVADNTGAGTADYNYHIIGVE